MHYKVKENRVVREINLYLNQLAYKFWIFAYNIFFCLCVLVVMAGHFFILTVDLVMVGIQIHGLGKNTG